MLMEFWRHFRLGLGVLGLLLMGGVSASVLPHHSLTVTRQDYQQSTPVPPFVLHLALKARLCALAAHEPVKHPNILTIIDYGMPSTQKRLWVINLNKNDVLLNLHVAHGKGSGQLRSHVFSNIMNSHDSSLGLFLTGGTFYGKHGKAMRLHGLNLHTNSLANKRAIEVHGAWYVSYLLVKETGRIGRSYGCPAVNLKHLHQLIDLIQGGSLMFSYYPDAKWMQSSRWLHCGVNVRMDPNVRHLHWTHQAQQTSCERVFLCDR